MTAVIAGADLVVSMMTITLAGMRMGGVIAVAVKTTSTTMFQILPNTLHFTTARAIEAAAARMMLPCIPSGVATPGMTTDAPSGMTTAGNTAMPTRGRSRLVDGARDLAGTVTPTSGKIGAEFAATARMRGNAGTMTDTATTSEHEVYLT